MTQPPIDTNADWPLDDDEGYTSATAAERMASADGPEETEASQGSAFELPAYDAPYDVSAGEETVTKAEDVVEESDEDAILDDAIVLPPMLADFAATPAVEAPADRAVSEAMIPEGEPVELEPFTVPEDPQAFFEGWEATLVQVPSTPIVEQVAADLNINIQDLLGVRL